MMAAQWRHIIAALVVVATTSGVTAMTASAAHAKPAQTYSRPTPPVVHSTIRQETHHDVSSPLRSMRPQPPTPPAHGVIPWRRVPRPTAAATAGHSYTLTLTNHDDNYSGDPTYTKYDDVALS